IEHLAMQLTQHLLFILIAVLRTGARRATFALRRDGAIGNGPLPDAAALDKDLRLQQLLAFARLALHVVDGVFVPNIGIETKNHALQAFPGSVKTGSTG